MSTQNQHEAAELHAHQAEQDRLKNPVPDDNAVAAVEELYQEILVKSMGYEYENSADHTIWVAHAFKRQVIQIAQDTGTVYAYRKRAAEIKAER